MSKLEEKLKELENKIEGLSKQLGNTQQLIVTLTKYLTDFSGFTAQWIEERRKEAETKGEKRQLPLYYRGLVMGLFLGVVGNFLVSFYMKVLDVFNITFEGWICLAIIALGGIAAWVWFFNKEIRRLSSD